MSQSNFIIRYQLKNNFIEFYISNIETKAEFTGTLNNHQIENMSIFNRKSINIVYNALIDSVMQIVILDDINLSLNIKIDIRISIIEFVVDCKKIILDMYEIFDIDDLYYGELNKNYTESDNIIKESIFEFNEKQFCIQPLDCKCVDIDGININVLPNQIIEILSLRHNLLELDNGKFIYNRKWSDDVPIIYELCADAGIIITSINFMNDIYVIEYFETMDKYNFYTSKQECIKNKSWVFSSSYIQNNSNNSMIRCTTKHKIFYYAK